MDLMANQEFFRLVVAMLLGGLIGIEREVRDKAAGFRTLILISAGACLFTIFSSQLGDNGDPNRIAANIVTGIGFLGAGVILRDGGQIKGLTTASTIWLVAAIGMGVGFGRILFSAAATFLFIVVLWLFPFVERKMSKWMEVHVFRIKIRAKGIDDLDYFKNIWIEHHLKVTSLKTLKNQNDFLIQCSITGNPKNQSEAIRTLLEHESVIDLSY